MKRFALGVGSVGLCLIMQSAVSQTLEEVVVTAQKREQSLQDIPIAVEAYSGQQLTSRGVSNLDDLANVSPSYAIPPAARVNPLSVALAQTFSAVAPMPVSPITWMAYILPAATRWQRAPVRWRI